MKRTQEIFHTRNGSNTIYWILRGIGMKFWNFVLFNDAWSQKGHSASNTTVILASSSLLLTERLLSVNLVIGLVAVFFFVFFSTSREFLSLQQNLALASLSNFLSIFMTSIRSAVWNLSDLTDDLAAWPWPFYTFTFWAITLLLLEKTSPNFYWM